jgi:hypothetical protein
MTPMDKVRVICAHGRENGDHSARGGKVESKGGNLRQCDFQRITDNHNAEGLVYDRALMPAGPLTQLFPIRRKEA